MSFKVLVVDDDRASLELMKEVLSGLGTDVWVCDDGEEAARRVNLSRYDGIFLDLMMPKLDGFRLARAIRQSSWNRNCPIVVISGNDDGTTMKAAFAAGGNFFLRKPIDRRRLQMLLNASYGPMLDNRRGFTRVPLDIEVVCHVSPMRVTKRRAMNISERGLLLSPSAELEVGQSVKLQFQLPDQNGGITTAGVVTRVDDVGRTGISFTQIRTTDRQRIRLHVSACVGADVTLLTASVKTGLRTQA